MFIAGVTEFVVEDWVEVEVDIEGTAWLEVGNIAEFCNKGTEEVNIFWVGVETAFTDISFIVLSGLISVDTLLGLKTIDLLTLTHLFCRLFNINPIVHFVHILGSSLF